MTPELKALEMEIFKNRKDRRIKNIREAFAAVCRSLEKPKKGVWDRVWPYLLRGQYRRGE